MERPFTPNQVAKGRPSTPPIHLPPPIPLLPIKIIVYNGYNAEGGVGGGGLLPLYSQAPLACSGVQPRLKICSKNLKKG
jgi:hypothetical protein